MPSVSHRTGWGVQLCLRAAVRRNGTTRRARLAEMGYGAVWFPEARGKEAFTHAGVLLAAGSPITVATGIASIWARDAMATSAAANVLAEAHPGRFVMGLGVSHPRLVRRYAVTTIDTPSGPWRRTSMPWRQRRTTQ